MSRAKHCHHFVPRRYLRAWSRNGNGSIAVRIGSGPARWTSVGGIAFKEKCYSYDPLTPELLRSILCCRPRSRLVSDAMMRGFFFHTVVVQVLWRLLKNPADRDALAMWRIVQESNMVDEVGAVEIERLYHSYYDDPQQFDKKMQDYREEGYENVLSNKFGSSKFLVENLSDAE